MTPNKRALFTTQDATMQLRNINVNVRLRPVDERVKESLGRVEACDVALSLLRRRAGIAYEHLAVLHSLAHILQMVVHPCVPQHLALGGKEASVAHVEWWRPRRRGGRRVVLLGRLDRSASNWRCSKSSQAVLGYVVLRCCCAGAVRSFKFFPDWPNSLYIPLPA
jgi:hypothetical protein